MPEGGNAKRSSTPGSGSSGGQHGVTSVAAKRRQARAAAANLSTVITSITGTPSPGGRGGKNNGSNSAAPRQQSQQSRADRATTMLDLALQGTPVSTYDDDDDDDADADAEDVGVLGAVVSPRSWKGPNPSKSQKGVVPDLDSSREGLIGSDDLSPTSGGPAERSDADDRAKEEAAEERKSRFLSKMIMRVSLRWMASLFVRSAFTPLDE